MTKSKPQPILYLIPRTDIMSMNPGKAMAQCSHAANQCVKAINELGTKKLKTMLKIWEGESGKGFGTTIVLAGGTLDNIKEIVSTIDGNIFNDGDDVETGIVLDDTYPLKDGDAMHFFPLETCGYVFCEKGNEVVQRHLAEMELHP